MSLTTITTRLSVVLSFRTRCPEASPASTNVDGAWYTWGVQVGSFPSYSVAVPDLTITKLGPGWLCQPNVPPGTTAFCTTSRCEAPYASMITRQEWDAKPGSMSVLVKMPMAAKAPLR